MKRKMSRVYARRLKNDDSPINFLKPCTNRRIILVSFRTYELRCHCLPNVFIADRSEINLIVFWDMHNTIAVNYRYRFVKESNDLRRWSQSILPYANGCSNMDLDNKEYSQIEPRSV